MPERTVVRRGLALGAILAVLIGVPVFGWNAVTNGHQAKPNNQSSALSRRSNPVHRVAAAPIDARNAGWALTKNEADVECVIMASFGPTNFLHIIYDPNNQRISLVSAHRVAVPGPAGPTRVAAVFDGNASLIASKAIRSNTGRGTGLENAVIANFDDAEFIGAFEHSKRLEIRVNDQVSDRYILPNAARGWEMLNDCVGSIDQE